MRIMMSAAGSAVAPGIIRHLQKLGHYVIGHDGCAFGYGATICDEFHKSPPVSEAWEYSHFIRDVKYDLYLPFLEHELLVFTNPSYDVPDRTVCSDVRTLRGIIDKEIQQEWLEEADLPMAPGIHKAPCVLKGQFGQGGRNVLKLGYAEPWIIALMSQYCVVQKLIEGDEYTVDVLVGRDGRFLYAVPRRRLQASGVSVIGRIEMDKEIIDLAKLVTKTIEFAGPINIQMIRDKAGKLYIIEINPRLSGSCMFTVMAGFDILDATIRLWSGEPFVQPVKIEEITVRRHYVEERL
jgi:carbamoyl-phosphate synthase large subunit